MPGIATPSIVRLPASRACGGGDDCEGGMLVGGLLGATPIIVLPSADAGGLLAAGGAAGGEVAAANPSIVRFSASPGRAASDAGCDVRPGVGVGARLFASAAASAPGDAGAGDTDAGCGPGEKCIIVRFAGDAIAGTAVGTGAVCAFASGVPGTVDAAARGVSAPHCPQNLARSGSG
jgi:hypothetical protein